MQGETGVEVGAFAARQGGESAAQATVAVPGAVSHLPAANCLTQLLSKFS